MGGKSTYIRQVCFVCCVFLLKKMSLVLISIRPVLFNFCLKLDVSCRVVRVKRRSLIVFLPVSEQMMIYRLACQRSCLRC